MTSLSRDNCPNRSRSTSSGSSGVTGILVVRIAIWLRILRRRLVVSEHDGLSQDLFHIYTAIIFTAPLDELGQHVWLNSLSGLSPTRVLQNEIVISEHMSNVGTNRKLNTSGQRKLLCVTDRTRALLPGGLEYAIQ